MTCYYTAMIHEILPVGLLQCNCSIFGDEASGDAFVIDPGDETGKIQGILKQRKLAVKALLFTHAHIDHIGRAASLKAATGAPAYLHRREIPILESLEQQAVWLGLPAPEAIAIDQYYEEGDLLRLGPHEFRVLFTPGHSPGSVSFYLPTQNAIVGGDVLFRDGIGRTDLPGANADRLLQTLQEKFLPLDDSVTVIPGHGPLTSIGREREGNPFLRGLAQRTFQSKR